MVKNIEYINIPGLAYTWNDIFSDAKKVKIAKQKQEVKILELYDYISNTPGSIAINKNKPNKLNKCLYYILSKSIRKGVDLQLSVFLKDFNSDELIPLSHQNINNFEKLKDEIRRSSGQQWQVEQY